MDHSPLARLPAELRNIIYHDVLVSEGPVLLHVANVKGMDGARRYDSKPLLDKSLGLLLTCKAIHSETLPIFYGSNTFKLLTPQLDAAQDLCDFLQNTTVLRNSQLLRHVTLHLRYVDVQVRSHRLRKALRNILNEARASLVELPACKTSVVLMVEGGLSGSYLGLELKTWAKESMDSSISECLKQIHETVKTNALLMQHSADLSLHGSNTVQLHSRLIRVLGGLCTTFGEETAEG